MEAARLCPTQAAGNRARDSQPPRLPRPRAPLSFSTARAWLPGKPPAASPPGGKSTTVRWKSSPGSGEIQTRDAYGDVQLHIEWATPEPPSGIGQDRGNSGIFLMGLYELQVLDSYRANTYTDGQAAAIYGQYPPTL